MLIAPEEEDSVCKAAPVPDAVDDDVPVLMVEEVFEPVTELVAVTEPVPALAVISAAAVAETDDDPLACVASASLPASELSFAVGDPL